MKGKSGIMRKFKWGESYKEEVDENEKMWNNIKMFEGHMFTCYFIGFLNLYIHTDTHLYKYITGLHRR